MLNLSAEINEMCETKLNSAIQVHEKHAREVAINEVKDEVIATLC